MTHISVYTRHVLKLDLPVKTAIFNADRKQGFSTLLFILQNQTDEWHQSNNHDNTESWEQPLPRISSCNFCMREGLEGCHQNLHALHWETWGYDVMSNCPSWSESNWLWWKKGRRLTSTWWWWRNLWAKWYDFSDAWAEWIIWSQS